MPLSISTVIFFTQPILTAVIAFIFLKEKLKIIDIISIFSAMFGLIILVKPKLILGSSFIKQENLQEKAYPHFYLGAVFAFIAAICSAFAYLMVRLASSMKLHSSLNGFYFGFIATILSIIVLGVVDFPIKEEMTFYSTGMMLLIGFFGFLGQDLLSKAL